MNRINKHNYESYLIDMMEGNLSASLTEELMAFLDDNPEIRQEFEEFENVILEPEQVSFKNKNRLKQQEIMEFGKINEFNYENRFIAYHECDLTEDEKLEVEQFVKLNPFLKAGFEQFGKLTVSADDSVVYEAKEGLYQHRKVIPLYWITTAAAVIVVLIAWGIIKYDTFVLPEDSGKNEVVQVMAFDNNDSAQIVADQNISLTPDIKNEEIPSEMPVQDNESEKVDKTESNKKIIHNKPPVKEYVTLAYLPVANPDIKLTEEETYCRFRNRSVVPGKSPDPVKKKSVVGKLVAGLLNSAKKKVVPVVSEKNDEPLLAKVFDGGAQILNNYTGTEANVTKYYDNRGNLVAYHFSGGRIAFSKRFTSKR